MAESTLSVTISTIRDEVARYLQLGRDYSALSSTLRGDIDSIVNRGLRRFYFPPQIEENRPPHQWTFLEPVATLDVGPNVVTTNTNAITSSSIVILADPVMTMSLVGQTVTVDGVARVIASVVNATTFTVDTPLSSVAPGSPVLATHNGLYPRPFPDDFGGITGFLTYEPDGLSNRDVDALEFTRESRIRLLQHRNNNPSWPTLAAVRPVKYQTPSVPATEGQRYELLVWPVPDRVYTLRYRYTVLPDAMDGTNNIFPYGGMAHGETILASCLSVAEQMAMDSKSRGTGMQMAEYMARLRASIAVDRRSTTGDNLGYVGDDSDMKYGSRRLSRHDSVRVSYNGVFY